MNTYKTFLMKGTTASSTTTWAKLLDIKDYPDLFGEPEKLEKTTLSHRAHVYEEGIEENDGLDFTANYDKDTFDTLRALKGQELDLAVWFGGTENGDEVTPTGADGKFKCKGKISVSITGKGVNEVREMKVSVCVTSPLVEDSAT